MQYSASADSKTNLGAKSPLTPRSGDTTPTPPVVHKLIKPGLRRTQSHGPTLLLADRGDNAAKLLPTSEGRLVLQVSIGGRKLLLNPERPSEIQYHNEQGKVVTRSLLADEPEGE